MLPWLVILAAVFVVPSYLIAPLNVWRSARSRPIRTRPIRPGEAPSEIRSAVEAVARTLGGSGFRLATVAEPLDGGAVIVHAYHPTTGEHFLDYITDAARWQVFLTTYPDGSEVVTSNSPAPSIFSGSPNLHVCTLGVYVRDGDVYRTRRLTSFGGQHPSIAHAAGNRPYRAGGPRLR